MMTTSDLNEASSSALIDSHFTQTVEARLLNARRHLKDLIHQSQIHILSLRPLLKLSAPKLQAREF